MQTAGIAIGGAVFLANAGLLILQLTAGKLLAPFVGSSLETWTTVIGVLLAGIAAGNWLGGNLAATRRTLFLILLACPLATLWMVVFPELLHRTGWHTSLSLTPRIILLTSILCFPAGLTLSMLTPIAVRLGTRDLRIGGRIAGLTFALGTLGCLAGNYLTGFWLIPSFTINNIVYGVAAALALLLVVPCFVSTADFASTPTTRLALPNLRSSYVIVFTCSFAGMALELAGVRLMAQIVGVSLFTWTGVIGVMLVGTCFGNALGGILADRASRRGSSLRMLATCLVLAGASAALIIITFIVSQGTWFLSLGIVARVVVWSFVLFALPMGFLGTITPQVIRLVTHDASQAGPIAGRLYAVSTIGAIVGTFATGFWLIAEIGVFRVVLLTAILPTAVAIIFAKIWFEKALLYIATIVGGIAFGGMILFNPATTGIARESNYFTIQVKPAPKPRLAEQGVLVLQLDRLIHSWVKPGDPMFLYYEHEQIQLAVLREIASRIRMPRTLVIGGGGYTFPRAARTAVPSNYVEVVEIDPAVTDVTYERLDLDPKLKINPIHMDGRAFVSERVRPGSYELITMDAVNDLSVPSHLLTDEFHALVKQALTPDGVYLVTVIDQPDIGQIAKSTVHTLRNRFAHVHLITSEAMWNPSLPVPYVIYASDRPYDGERLREIADRDVGLPRIAGFGAAAASTTRWQFANEVSESEVQKLFAAEPPVFLRDQYSPVDWLMADVFRRRKFEKFK